MDHRSRWFDQGDSLARKTLVQLVPAIINDAVPHAPRIWERPPVYGQNVAPNPARIVQIVYGSHVALSVGDANGLYGLNLTDDAPFESKSGGRG